MMNDLQEEQACFYVLGLLPEHEVAAFEREMQQSAELTALVASLNNATLALAKSAPQVELPAEAKRRLLAAVSQLDNRVVPIPRSNIFRFIPWAAAACLAFATYFLWNTSQHEKRNFEASVNQSNVVLKTVQSKLDETQAALQMLQQQSKDQLAAAEAARTELLTRIASLEEKNLLAQTKIAVMSSKLKDRPQAIAVSLWDQEKQNGLLVVENLPVLDTGRDYQLWVIDPNVAAPVSAGTFKVDEKGKVRISFKPTLNVATATTFAVTEEKEGGVPSPTMEKMVVIGGI